MKSTESIIVTPKEAGLLIAARVSESTDGLEENASRDACLVAGNDLKSRLLARAKLILSRRSLQPARAPKWPVSWVAGTLALLAYFLGVATDRFASEGAVVNLLSPALLLILLWQIALYVVLFVAGLLNRFGRAPSLPGRTLFTRLVTQIRLPSWTSRSAETYAQWLPLYLPSLQYEAARAFHWAAAALGVGLLTGLAFRGIGTAYTVGWTSTWFDGHEAMLSQLFSATYGLIPLELFGFPFPDATALSELNLRLHPEGSPDAAVWLIRLMGLVTGVVILPRVLLALRAGHQARVARERLLWVPLAAEVEIPLHNVPQRDGAPNLQTSTLPCAVLAERAWSDEGQKQLHEILQQPKITFERIRLWKDNPQTILTNGHFTHSVLVADATSTPEEDVHGTWLQALAERTDKNVTLLVDLRTLEERFVTTPERIASRKALWETFATDHHAEILLQRLQ